MFRRHTRIRGTSYHQSALKALSNNVDPYSYRLSVKEEAKNQYDPNALSVIAEVCINNRLYNLKLGYLSKNIAESAKQFLSKGKVIQIIESCVTGKGRTHGYLGINLTYIFINSAHR